MLKLPVFVVTMAWMTVPTRADWSTYQGNAAHTGYVSGTIDALNLSVKWSTSITTFGVGDLAVGGNGVYVHGPGVAYTALNEETGSIIWNIPYLASQWNSTSAPAYANGMVYYQTDDNTINLFHGLNAATGAQVFATPYGAQWETYLNPTPYGDNVYTGGGRFGGIYSYNATSGAQNWFGYEEFVRGWTPAVDGKYAYTLMGNADIPPAYGEFRMINLTNGSATYVVTDTNPWSITDILNSAVVLGPHNDAFAINGGRLISISTQADTTHTPHFGWERFDKFTGQPTLANGVLYADDNGMLAALDESTGNTLWTWTPPSGTLDGPMIATDNVLFLSTASTTYALDLATRQIDWSYNISGYMALSDDTLFVSASNTNGTVYAFSAPEPSSAIGFVVLGFGLLIRSRRGV